MKENFKSNLNTAETIIHPPIESTPSLIELYTSIMQFQISDEDSLVPFHVKLAKENGWLHEHAKRVEIEYKRFLILAVFAGHPVSPSDPVDQAWHLHLTYTRSYWDGLCKDVLRMPLHHTPSRGGPAEVAKFDFRYLSTIRSYEKIFGFPPNEDIWPCIEYGNERNPDFKRISTRDHWVIRKPFFRRLVAKKNRTPEIRYLAITTALILAGIFTSAHAMKDSTSDSVFGMIGTLFLLPMIVMVLGYFLYVRQLCPACGKWNTFRKTGLKNKSETKIGTDLVQWSCSSCAHVTWKEVYQCG